MKQLLLYVAMMIYASTGNERDFWLMDEGENVGIGTDVFLKKDRLKQV